ncbi:MAG: 2-hydroxychromene-2-carboxylate isomerase [Myxococcota bacterium]|nr:2-hydroxychromene-2-carboxylate isomerase [Myxococcota bacterium]
MIEFFYDIGSPYSYLASERIEALAERTGTQVWWRPFLLSGVFREVGADLGMSLGPQQRNMVRDLGRWAQRMGVSLRFPEVFPVPTTDAMRLVVLAPRAERAELSHVLFRALWGEGRDLSDPSVLQDLLGDERANQVAQSEADLKLERITQEAIARGAFGSPSFFVGDELFFGNDRMDFLEEALQRSAARG